MIINRGFIIPAREFKIFIPENGDTVYVGIPFTMEVSTVGLEDTTTVYMNEDEMNKILGQFTSTGGNGSGEVLIDWDYVDVASADIIENGETIEIVGHNPCTLKITDGVRVLYLDLDVIGNKDFSMGKAEVSLKYLPDLTDETILDFPDADASISAEITDREHLQKVVYGTAGAAITYEIKNHRMIFSSAECNLKYLPDLESETVQDAGSAEVDIHAAVEDRDRSDRLGYGKAAAETLLDNKISRVNYGDARATVWIHQ